MTLYDFFNRWSHYLPIALLEQFERDLHTMVNEERTHAREEAGQD